jgi:phage FluMu protein Com
MTGMQRRFVCTKCGKVFFAWRPDTAPGVKVKCYFCKNEMEDEAARRVRPAPPPAAPAVSPESAAPASPAAPAPAAAPPAGESPAPDKVPTN